MHEIDGLSKALSSLKCLSARFVIDMRTTLRWQSSPSGSGLKCLSARFVIDITYGHCEVHVSDHGSLKCLSARFVIDMKSREHVFTGHDGCLKCLSARFVIDIHLDNRGNRPGTDGVSNAFRLDS